MVLTSQVLSPGPLSIVGGLWQIRQKLGGVLRGVKTQLVAQSLPLDGIEGSLVVVQAGVLCLEVLQTKLHCLAE